MGVTSRRITNLMICGHQVLWILSIRAFTSSASMLIKKDANRFDYAFEFADGEDPEFDTETMIDCAQNDSKRTLAFAWSLKPREDVLVTKYVAGYYERVVATKPFAMYENK